jgi:hypothetical protein
VKFVLAICAILLFGSQCGFSQSFVNLDFESANVPDVPTNQGGGNVSVTLGMPGWTAYLGAGQSSQIFHNDVSGGGALVAIEGPQWPSAEILQGNYTAFIIGSQFSTPTSAAIAQTGQIPMNSESLLFYTSQSSFASFQVTFGGQQIPVEQIGVGPNYYIMGGDISAYAGQTAELRFTALPDTGGFLDNIQFSMSPVPEPATLAVFATGAVLLALRRRRRRAN